MFLLRLPSTNLHLITYFWMIKFEYFGKTQNFRHFIVLKSRKNDICYFITFSKSFSYIILLISLFCYKREKIKQKSSHKREKDIIITFKDRQLFDRRSFVVPRFISQRRNVNESFLLSTIIIRRQN